MNTKTTPAQEPEDLSRDIARLLQRALAKALLPAGDGDDLPALTIEPAAQAIAPAQLARAHPGGPKSRREAEALYHRCLKHYREVVRADDTALGIDDMGAAMAYFVAANVYALKDTPVTAQMLLRVEQQLRGVVGRSTEWVNGDARDKQSLFEQLAILGVLVGESAAQAKREGPAAVANVQRAARGYLSRLLGLNADALTIDGDGLDIEIDAANDSAVAAD
jgi:hypothetical protein